MGSYPIRSVLSVSKEIEDTYQDIATLLARLIHNPCDIAAIQKLAAMQTQLEKLESMHSALQRFSLPEPPPTRYVA